MKILVVVLAALMLLSLGFLIGRSYNIQSVKEVLRNDCEQLGGFAIGKRVYTCERVKKEKK